MDEGDLDLQHALHMSLGGSAGDLPAAPTPAPALAPPLAGGFFEADEDTDIQQAMLLSMGTSSAVAAGPAAALARAPREARELMKTVIGNLEKAARPECDSAQAAKYRQLNDGVLRRKLGQASAPDEAIKAATNCLQSLGFALGDARWILPEGTAPAPSLLEDLHKAASADTQPCSDANIRVVPGGGGSSSIVHAPTHLRDFDCHQVGQLRGLPVALQLFAYPRNCIQFVESADCVPWASTTGSGRSHWGSFGRRGEDDRVTLTLCCGSGHGGGDGCVAHWYSPDGQERTMPSLQAQAGRWHWTETHMNQTFVLRAFPQQSIALCGIKILCRPYETDGHLVLMIMPLPIDGRDLLQQAGRVTASLPEDKREQAAQPQGGKPAPPPPGWRNHR